MRLTILCSGTFIPDKRGCASYLLESNKEKIIFDFGREAIANLLALKTDPLSLHHIFISHQHADHFSEISSLIAFILDHPNKNKVYQKMTTIYGPKGIKEAIENMLCTFGLSNHKYRERLNIQELKDREMISINSASIQAYYVTHAPEITATAYRVTKKNKSFVYSGDAAVCLALEEACTDANVALLEATLPRYSCPKTHMSGDDAGMIAKKANVEHLILTHIANTYTKNVVRDVKKYFKGKTTLATNFMTIKI